MSKMLQIFTLSYPYSYGECPKVMVLFTNFSATQSPDDSDEISFDEDSEQETEADQSSDIGKVTLLSLISKFREDLVIKINDDLLLESTSTA